MPFVINLRRHLDLTARVIVFLAGVLYKEILEWIDRMRLRKQRFLASIPYFLHDAHGKITIYFYKARIKKIQEAVCGSDISKVEQLLDSCTNEQVIRAALCSAVTLDDTEILHNILKLIKNTNLSVDFYKQQQCQYNQSPLHLSCSQGKGGCVTLLLRSGFIINVLDEYNRTPLWEAIYNGHSSVAALLLSCDNVDVNTVTSELIPETKIRCKSTTVLMCASLLEDSQSIIGICQHNPYPNVVDLYKATPLHHVCYYGNKDCVRALLACGADINARDANRQTPLYTACRHGHIDIGTVLLESGAEINQKSEAEISIAHTARFVPLSERYRVIKYAKYPLMAAIDNCHSEIVPLLISYGADTHLELPHNLTPLHIACSEGNLAIVETLVNNGADVNAKMFSEKTPLFYCVRNGKYQTAWSAYSTNRYRGYDEQTWDSYLDSLEEGNAILEYLIKQGADLNCKDNQSLTSADHAWIACRTSTVFILLKYGGKISDKFLQKGPLESFKLLQKVQANINMFRIVLKHNFQFRHVLPTYIETTLNFKTETSEPDLLSFLSEIGQPCSLKDQCRICIRSCINKYGIEFHNCIYELSLPNPLKSFLMFGDLEHCVRLRDTFPEQL